MVTVSTKMQDFFALLKKVAVTEASVLMRGETGTGKELAARAIHTINRRLKRPVQRRQLRHVIVGADDVGGPWKRGRAMR